MYLLNFTEVPVTFLKLSQNSIQLIENNCSGTSTFELFCLLATQPDFFATEIRNKERRTN